MQTEDIEVEVKTRKKTTKNHRKQKNELQTPCLNGLDAALHRLGMLATQTNARREYLKEIERYQHRTCLNMVRINTRYVSNVSIGFRVRPTTPHVRYKPYIPKERHRTRSENNEEENTAKLATVNNEQALGDDLTQLKKAKSLESIVAESNNGIGLNGSSIEIGSLPELEIVSNSIQNLRVAE